MGSVMSSWALSPSGMAACTMSNSLCTGLMLSFILGLAARACSCGWHWNFTDLSGVCTMRHDSFSLENQVLDEARELGGCQDRELPQTFADTGSVENCKASNRYVKHSGPERCARALRTVVPSTMGSCSLVITSPPMSADAPKTGPSIALSSCWVTG